jgi:peptidoglycan/xylan/chitin deacetylase (PgdA/CDA1 family)
MTTGDHRSTRVAEALAFAGTLVTGAYAFPALAGALPALRAPLGIAQRTVDGRGYGLTFDDGPHRHGTPAVLDALAERGVRATFFLVGEQVARNPALAAEIVAAGHGVGLHCDRHRNQLRLGPRAVREDIMRATARIEETTGRPIERYRPPYGIFNAAALALVRRNGRRARRQSRSRPSWSEATSRRGRCCSYTTPTTTAPRAPGAARRRRCRVCSTCSRSAASNGRSAYRSGARGARGCHVAERR